MADISITPLQDISTVMLGGNEEVVDDLYK
jgi:hypothetical protein